MLKLKLYFLLGEKKPHYLSVGEDILINILNRLSLAPEFYEIDYCYYYTPASKKMQRYIPMEERMNILIQYMERDPEQVIVCMGWMATELMSNISKMKRARVIGCRFSIAPFRYDTWFTHDPGAALFDPNLYVDLMAHVSAAMRYARHDIEINKKVQPYEWPI